MPRALLRTLWLLALPLVAASAVVAADDQQYLDGLRARGLFELAERYCTDRLASELTSESQRADLTIELSRTFAAHALAAPPAEAPRLWEQAQQTAERFAVLHPSDPKLILVKVQGALALAVQGEAARAASEGPHAPESPEAARGVLRRAIAELDKLARQRPARPTA